MLSCTIWCRTDCVPVVTTRIGQVLSGVANLTCAPPGISWVQAQASRGGAPGGCVGGGVGGGEP
ncbi:hypothetical protein GCM10009679_71530 [Saccharothrix algeriensis]|uniref:Uncharacterized protein n=1 Tax=Catellatospora bangladeshensis TaxID=310355 RepID=A0A8J3JWK4_9ACTN|nr:hypothetical protein Cba03nite_77070 [Catellatospora bangladeshensis]